jgi:hypothetical protein
MAFSSCSPDLAPLVFAIFGYLKDQMYKGQFNESEELQEENVHCCRKIDYKMLWVSRGEMKCLKVRRLKVKVFSNFFANHTFVCVMCILLSFFNKVQRNVLSF